MPTTTYERLSAQDNSFLVAEHAHAPLHVGAVGIYDSADLATDEGGVDIRKLRLLTEAQLHRIPRYRQRLEWIPIENRPVWVDDHHFNIDYHVRHAALPKPGGLKELKKLVARITSHQLDRARPLWEIWVVEGLEHNRFALITKVHHCMIDGVSGADIAQILMSPGPVHEIPEPKPFRPRAQPSREKLLAEGVRHQLTTPARALGALGSFLSRADHLLDDVGARLGAVADLASWIFNPASETPINGPLGPHRRIDWVTLSLDDVKTLKRSLGCTINDIVLATVTGAVRHYLIRRNLNLSTLAEMKFRVSIPVNMRREEERGMLGNHVSAWVVELPVGQDKPLQWVEKIQERTMAVKNSNQALGVETMMQFAEYAPASLMAMGAAAASGPVNMVVTNVPGPQFPLYLLGAKLRELHPLVPLLDGMGLGVALFSYDGKLHVGLNAEYDLVPDLEAFTALFAQSYLELLHAAKVHPQTEVTPKRGNLQVV